MDWEERLDQWELELELKERLEGSDWVTLERAAADTGTSRAALRTWYRTGQIPSRCDNATVVTVPAPQRDGYHRTTGVTAGTDAAAGTPVDHNLRHGKPLAVRPADHAFSLGALLQIQLVAALQRPQGHVGQ